MEVQQYSTLNTGMHSKYETEILFYFIFFFWGGGGCYIYTYSQELQNWSIQGHHNEVCSIRLRIRSWSRGLEAGHVD